MNFKLLSLLLIIFGLSNNIISQYRTEIEVTKECKQYVDSKQLNGQIATKPIEMVSNIAYNIYFRYAYKNQSKILFVGINELMFDRMEMASFRISFNGKVFDLGKMVDFVIDQKLTLSLEIQKTFYAGFELTDSLINAIQNLEECSLSFQFDTGKRMEWEVKKKFIQENKLSYLCFESNTSEIIAEYQNNLKEFETSFRDYKWGENKKVIIDNENLDIIINEDDLLSYSVVLNNDPFTCFFEFTTDKLYRGTYQYNGEYINENNFYSKFEELCSVLESKYELPVKIKKYRNKELWNEQDEIGMAIQTGEYTEIRTWETKDSFIYAKIFGENFKTTIQIVYESKDIKIMTQAKKLEEQKSIKGF